MMQKRTLVALLLMAFVAVFASSSVLANEVIVQSKNAPRATTTVVNVDAVVSADSISALEIVLEITGALGGIPAVAFAPGFTALNSTRLVDLSQADGNSPDTVRILAIRTNGTDDALLAGTTQVVRLTLPTANVADDSIVVANTVFDYDTTGTIGDITTQFVDAADASTLPVAVTSGTVTFVNASPTLVSTPDDTTFPYGTFYVDTIQADDPDLANGGEVLTYAKVSGPANLQVDASSGQIAWATGFDDVCGGEVVVSVTDSFGASV